MFQNRLGLYLEGNLRLRIPGSLIVVSKIYVLSNLRTGFTETRLEDVDLSKRSHASSKQIPAKSKG